MKNTHSYNCGRPVDLTIVPTLSETINLFDRIRFSGKIFRVDFIKRGDGTMRTMVCRCGVRKYLKGGKASYKFSDKGLLSVYEYGKGYRSVPIDNIYLIKFEGVLYRFDTELEPGNYLRGPLMLQAAGLRTPRAFTSPMFEAVTDPSSVN